MHGGLGGAMALTFGYARNPLRVGGGAQRLSVVSDEAFGDVGAALTYDRFRLYLDLTMPLLVQGQSGTIGGYSFTAPSLNLAQNPDTISDPRLGFDVRIFGGPDRGFRLGAGAQLFAPNGDRADYDTDQTFRAMLRVLFAGDARHFAYAGHLGVHVCPLDEAPTPWSPHGHELLFGFAAGAKLSFGRDAGWRAVLGPEVYGATALRSLFGASYTAVEGLLSARFEGTADTGLQMRVKLGSGIGSDQTFGAPAFRAVLGVEIFAHRP